ncbi:MULTISPECIES: GNAT family N-acetyltransferase [unclassified Rhizobium]|uniref:GNAT family N-acetyltransferase n=1 Tax=unclassified Rhizobium TaxID=2613769 RepID=UPI001ADD39C3|nr:MULTISPECIES: GNAT family N-acetyltransferase [unclassified Rhizobium]MBO9126787.1 GNAT family N-acetyltransferase [Rhizobium sp. 16-488-2b]MBO9177234.1 GNAT family N-acetyltransferase [Rhizobium sp. 16-488-2a]
MKRTASASSELIIRNALPLDAQVMGAFGTLLVALHHKLDPQRFIETTRATPSGYARFLGRKIDDPNAIILVAEQGGILLGYVYGEIEGHDYMALRGPAGVVHDLFVDASRRREGIGRSLLQAILSEITARGAERVVLSTAHQNKTAQQLFAALGFRATMIEMTRELKD